MTIIATSQKRELDAICYRPYNNDPYCYPAVRASYNGELSGLAHFLAKNIKNATYSTVEKITCYNGRTETDYLDSNKNSENIRKLFNTDTKPACIPDYAFDRIRDSETLNEYWQRQANILAHSGIQLVKYQNHTEEKIYFIVDNDLPDWQWFDLIYDDSKHFKSLSWVIDHDPNYVRYCAGRTTISPWQQEWDAACKRALRECLLDDNGTTDNIAPPLIGIPQTPENNGFIDDDLEDIFNEL